MTLMRLAAVLATGLTGAAGRSCGRRRGRRLLRAGGKLRGGAVLAGLVLLGAAAPASAQTVAWSVVPSPDGGAFGDGLDGVSCVSAAVCTAVGGYAAKGGTDRTLIESWNGAHWSVVPSPSPGPGDDVLESVSCVLATACTAVGADVTSGNPYRTLAESWNGTAWSVVPSPSRGSGSDLHSVSCTAARRCTAAGYYATGSGHLGTLIESWNGTAWSIVPSPNPGTAGSIPDLRGVSCTSATACTAIGYYFTRFHGPGRTLIESWNGTAWSIMPSPSRGSDSYLQDVSCTSAAACTATGYYTWGGPDGPERALIESWNGTAWSIMPSADRRADRDLSSVSCVSAAACTAAGYSDTNGRSPTLIESWNGTRWSIVPSPNRGNASYLTGVSCTSATACTATGYYASRTYSRTLIESTTASK